MMEWRSTARNPNPSKSPPFATSTTYEDPSLSVSDQRTLYLVNIFIVNTTRFLNKFSAICEEKLSHVHRRILRLDATLTLLEAKLRSIDGVGECEENGSVEVAGPSNQPESQDPSSVESSSEPTCRSGKPSCAAVSVQQKTSILSVHSEGLQVQHLTESIPCQHISMSEDDPRLSKFRRMLHFGVPEQMMKMLRT
ncbi:uncharacterized protein LOC131246479 isoform X2 [Magnolia sinica]|uniref:uncharacterized protein LOC131246479 isoform X2 n=1 Tax=Magnolia sinica TaxID=86752 RepID=UPI0026590CAC|nr:uncharacterized protein LOC131246479 isoform X2 [Magnolia sinica]